MLNTFVAVLTPLTTLFICMGIGFALAKLGVLPKDASKPISNLVVWVFAPALSFITMARYFTVETIAFNSVSLILSCVVTAVCIGIAIPLSRLFAKNGTYESNIYKYALAYANCGYMGDTLVQAIFGDVGLFYYKVFTLPILLTIYTWGMALLVKSEDNGKLALLKKVMNPSTVAMLIGIIVGITGLGESLPVVISSTFDMLKVCMGPMAMILAGVTVARYSIKKMLTNKKTYVASALRLVILPAIILSVLYLAMTILRTVFKLEISNSVIHLAFFAIATPLGLNTVVFPESYGGDPEPGAGMALVSHTLCVITIPLLFTVVELIFGKFMGLSH